MDREAEFRDLFVDQYPRVVGSAAFILQDWDRAEEVAQDAFMQLLQHWKRVRDYDQPAAWVRRVAIRLAIRSAKRERRLAGLLSVLRATPTPPPVDPAASLDLYAAVGQLSEKDRAVVVLRYFEDRTVPEIAQILECSQSAAKMRLHRARERLATMLDEEVDSHVG